MSDFRHKLRAFAWLGFCFVTWSISRVDPLHAQTVAPSVEAKPDVKTSAPQTHFALEDSLARASRPAEVVLPDVNEWMIARRLFARTFRLKPTDTSNRSELDSMFDKLRADWSATEMDFARFVLSTGEQIWVIREQEAARRGRGIYAIRPHANIRLILQAPHSRYDRHTRQIVARLFIESPSMAAAWSTVHRKQLDLAHVEKTYFQAFTDVVAQEVPKITVVQIHGFDEQKRKTHVARHAAMIVSNGTKSPVAWFTSASKCLVEELHPLDVRIFPRNTRELGGTSNVQANLLHRVGHGRFLHLEYNRFQRRQLVDNRSIRAELLHALFLSSRDMKGE